MNFDDLADLAEKAKINELVWFEHSRSISRFAALVAAAEREACAGIADQHSAPLVAGKIRARGE